MIRPKQSIPEDPDVLAMVRDLYIKRSETHYLEAYELQSLLCSLGYWDDLIPEAEIAAAIEVARTDLDPDEGAA
jgi:hypothetical protein